MRGHTEAARVASIVIEQASVAAVLVVDVDGNPAAAGKREAFGLPEFVRVIRQVADELEQKMVDGIGPDETWGESDAG